MGKYPINTDLKNDELYRLLKKSIECSTEGLINDLNITEKQFEKCSKHLKPTFAEYRKNVTKDHKQSEERLRKLEESQYK